GAVVRDSILMMDCNVGMDAVIERVILDKEVIVGSDCQIGYGTDMRSNRRFARHLSTGISVVGKRARVPNGYRIGRNCLIGPDVVESDFPDQNGRDIPSGGTVEATAPEKVVALRR